MDRKTVFNQLEVLCSIPNYHWWQYLTETGEKSSCNVCVSFYQHLLYNPAMDFDTQARILKSDKGHLPSSPRNQIMYFAYNKSKASSDRLTSTINHLLKYDRKEVDSLLPLETDEPQFSQPAKCRRCRSKMINVTSESFLEHVGVEQVTNYAPEYRDIYTCFCEELTVDGTIQWRKHTPEEEVVVMSAYSPSTGKMLPLSYVQITASRNDESTLMVKCTCLTYEKIKCAGLKGIYLEESEDAVLNCGHLTCMHCRFYKNKLDNCIDAMKDMNTTSNVLTKVQQSLAQMGNPIVLLGDDAAMNTTTKVSVIGKDDTLSLVHITFRLGACFYHCQNGVCQAKMLNKKKVAKITSVYSDGNVCCHLQTLEGNQEFITELFPDYFNGNEENSDTQVPTDNADNVLNRADALLRTIDHKVKFDVDTGKWTSESASKHKPMEQFDLDLVNNTLDRMSFIRRDNAAANGCFTGPDLIPSPFMKNGTPKPCNCGAAYANDDHPDGIQPHSIHLSAKIYTRNVSLHWVQSCCTVIQ
jgi:hypothetical protein